MSEKQIPNSPIQRGLSMYKDYPIVIHKDPESCYGVTVPDLPGCFSAGDTIEDAMTQTVEAIECYVEGLLLDGEPIPDPKDLVIHKNNPDFADGQWETVSVATCVILYNQVKY